MISQAFIDDLARVINKHSVDNDLSTPDFIAATYVANILVAKLNAQREVQRWSGMAVLPGVPLAETEDAEYLDVRAFQQKFGQLVGERPRFLTERKAVERIKFMGEELNEFVKGMNEKNILEMADALVDLVYVAKGTAVMMGLPWRALWNDVHDANMSKVPGKTHRGDLVDVCKPAGWAEPVTGDILDAYGFDDSAYCMAGADDEVHLIKDGLEKAVDRGLHDLAGKPETLAPAPDLTPGQPAPAVNNLDRVELNDWQVWRGGSCPVDGTAFVELRLRAKPAYVVPAARAHMYEWRHFDHGGDIVAYRVVPQGGER